MKVDEEFGRMIHNDIIYLKLLMYNFPDIILHFFTKKKKIYKN